MSKALEPVDTSYILITSKNEIILTDHELPSGLRIIGMGVVHSGSQKMSLKIRIFLNNILDTWLLSDEHQKFADAKKKRKNTYLQKAFEKKIWNEECPADMATAFEIRAILNRALGLPDNYQFFRKHFALMCEDKILRGKMKLWNEEQPYDLASDVEIAIMFTRAVTKNADLNTLVLSREQVAEVIGRDFL